MDAAPSRERNRTGARALTIALGAAIALLLYPFVSGLLGAGILYVVAAGALARLGVQRVGPFTALLTVLALFGIIVLPGVWLLTELVGQIPDTVRMVRENPAMQRLMALQIGALDVGSQLQQATSDIVSWSSRQTLTVLGGVMSATVNLMIALFGTYYLLTSRGPFWAWAKRLLPFSAATADVLRIRFRRVTEAMLLGVVLTATVQGTLIGLFLAALGFRHALFWGAVTAIVSILPMLGSALVWVPATLFLLMQERFGAALALGAFGVILVANIDNVLRLHIYRRVSQIHPMITLLGAFAGVRSFGLAGLLLGPLILSYGLELVQAYASSERAAPTPVAAPRDGDATAALLPAQPAERSRTSASPST